MSEIEPLLALWQSARDVDAYLWTFYAAVVLAVLGFACTQAYTSTSTLQRAATIVVVYAFLSVNGWSIWDNLAVYNAATEQLQTALANQPAGSVALQIGEIHRVHLLGVHAVVDACVLAVLVLRSRARA